MTLRSTVPYACVIVLMGVLPEHHRGSIGRTVPTAAEILSHQLPCRHLDADGRSTLGHDDATGRIADDMIRD